MKTAREEAEACARHGEEGGGVGVRPTKVRHSRGTQLVPEVENHQANVNHGSQLTVEGRGRGRGRRK